MTIGSDPGQKRFQDDGAHARVRLSRLLCDELRHNADLVQLTAFGQRRWSDALLAETRFQLAGVLNAVEMALGLHLADPVVEEALAKLGAGYCRFAIEQEMGLLSPELLAHLRRRAAVAMLLRKPPHETVEIAPLPRLSIDEADMLAALGIAEQRWCAPMLLESPIRPDLPAEHFHELAWTVAALLILGCERETEVRGPVLVKAVAHATERLIARHDEGQGAFALARRGARALSDEGRSSLAAPALAEGRLLLFAALVEVQTGIDLELALETLIGLDDSGRCALLRLMVIDDVVAFRAGELLAPLAGLALEGDAGLAHFLEQYRAFDQRSAEAWLVQITSPRPLAEKLALMERGQ